MNRLLATTAAIALCTAFASVACADDATSPAAADAQQPKTMQAAVDVQIQNAKALRAQGKFGDAAKALGQLMLVAPDNAAVVGEYGKALAQQGHSQDAVAFLTRAAQLQPNDWTFYSALGVAYDQLDKRKEAREAYDRALALKPGEPSVLNNYAVSRMLAGDYAGARKMLEQVQAMGGNDPKIAGNLAKLVSLEAAHSARTQSPETVAANPGARVPVAIASVQPERDPATVMIQKMPADPLAGPVGETRATHAPTAIAAAAPMKQDMTAPAPQSAVASVQPKTDPRTIVMQKVPVDPLAGPVGSATGAPHALADATSTVRPKQKPHIMAAASPVTAKPAVAKPKAILAKAAPKIPDAPALRTASDTN